MRWIWKHCLAPRSQLNIPKQIVYFMDPLEVIKTYKCPLHPVKSKLDSLELGVVYHYITGHNLNGRVFFWLLDRVVHQLYVTLIYCARNGSGPAAWTEYMKKNGRRRFQIDLG